MTSFLESSRTLFRSTPLRLALALVVLFAFVSLLSLGASYLVIRDSFNKSMEADLRQELAGFQAAASSSAVARLIAAEAAVTDPERRILSYVTADGKFSGNVRVSRSNEGFRILSLPDEHELSEGPYLALTSNLYGGQLSPRA